MKRSYIEINDVTDFNCIADDMLIEFMESLDGPEFVRPVTDDDEVDPDECDFLFTDRAVKLIDRMRDRLHAVGRKYFPPEEVDITTGYQEY